MDVAIPSYQYAPYLRESAMSVLSQRVPNLRLLIVDNGSTDGSQDIARDIAAVDDRVTLYLNARNRGMFHSYNRAIDWAEADYFILLDADDQLAADSLASAVDFLEAHPEVAFLYGVEGRLVDGLLDPGRCDGWTAKWGVVSGEDFIRQTCRDSFCDIGAPAMIMRTRALKKAGHLREELVRTNDFEMYLRLAMYGDVAWTNRVLGIRRLHQAQLSTPYNEHRVLDFLEHERAFESFFAHEGAAMPGASRLLAQARRAGGDYAYWYGLWQLLHRRPDARAAFAYAGKRRTAPVLLPPVGFLFKRRWLRSLYRAVRRLVCEPRRLSTPYADTRTSQARPRQFGRRAS
ncbi:glycosyltransferase family 2 protein [Mycobacterium sp. CPCC 205372]|uniref:Glycosyltransferase family 2 protein n=1 Tax=Mycobacterium hippophais TaxID=3016340 RepID=A0ABT4PS18_9MYCO|nr:glycosyltransferase family 2 protein [Mycobacterium hippophais]MCZ8379299.1 glycosyltransferase family 2 protein [Mycobacterium hippophais]